MQNINIIKGIKDLTEEERSLHLHYTVEFLEDNIKELYEVLSNELSTDRSINRLAFLTEMNDRIETMLDK